MLHGKGADVYEKKNAYLYTLVVYTLIDNK